MTFAALKLAAPLADQADGHQRQRSKSRLLQHSSGRRGRVTPEGCSCHLYGHWDQWGGHAQHWSTLWPGTAMPFNTSCLSCFHSPDLYLPQKSACCKICCSSHTDSCLAGCGMLCCTCCSNLPSNSYIMTVSWLSTSIVKNTKFSAENAKYNPAFVMHSASQRRQYKKKVLNWKHLCLPSLK